MKWLGKNKKYRGYFAAAFALLIVAMLFQNCGEIRVQPRTEAIPTGRVDSASATPSLIKIPEPPDYLMRAVFVVDMSRSMVTTACPGAVEFDVRSNPSTDCSDPNFGADSGMYRLEMIDKWLDEVENYMRIRGLPAENFKAVVIPFAGPSGNQRLNGAFRVGIGTTEYTMSLTNFGTIAQARKVVESLRTLQFAFQTISVPNTTDKRLTIPDVKVPVAGYQPDMRGFTSLVMDTSIPAPRVDVAKTAIANEINALGPDKLKNTRFEVVMFSDGIPKPYKRDMKTAMGVIWKFKQVFATDIPVCNAGNGYIRYWGCGIAVSNVDLNYCSSTCQSAIDKFLINNQIPLDASPQCKTCLEAPMQYNFQADMFNSNYNVRSLSELRYEGLRNFYDDVKSSWGDYLQNSPDVIIKRVKDIERLFKQYPSVQYRFNFMSLASKKTELQPRDEDATRDGNWLALAKETFKGSTRHQKVTSGQPNFSLFPGIGSSNSYKIGVLYAVNTLARVNGENIMDVDSDGDGIFDFEEEQLASRYGFRIDSARSNDTCLDVVTLRMGGCLKDACSALTDRDSDGLNECEEITLGTSDQSFDTDADAIPDLLEAIYGYNPLISDYDQDSNGDSTNNLTNFMRGLNPWHYINQLSADLLTRVSVSLVGYQSKTTLLGQVVKIPSYTVQVLNLRTAQTAAAIQALNISPFADFTHDGGVNRLQFFGRIDSVQNAGDSYWIHFHQDVNFSTTPLTIPLDLQKFKILNVKQAAP